jgi:predicted RND superfamily exporter protein
MGLLLGWVVLTSMQLLLLVLPLLLRVSSSRHCMRA